MTRAHAALGIIILFEILLLFIGCHGSNNPLVPEPVPGPDGILSDSNAAAVESRAAPPALWGLYEVAYNKDTHEIISVPLRGPAFAFNVTTFLQPPKGSLSGMTIGVLDDTTFNETGRLDIRVILHHPFPGQPVFTGFDVCGIFLTEGSYVSEYNPALRHADPEIDPTVLNPDGWTRWMNPAEFLSGDIWGFEPGWWGTSESSENSGFVASATMNPYKYFAHGLAPDGNLHDWLNDPDSIADRGIFPSGASCSRDYELLFPIVDSKIVFKFNYAAMANWTEPDIDPPEDPLTDFPPEANAGWPLHVFGVDNSSAYYTEDEAGGTISVDLEIFDWNALDNPEGVPGEISKFVFWSDQPLLENGWAEVMDTEVEWNSGFTASTSVATIELNAAPSQSGEIPLWIEIQSSNPSGYDQGFGADVPSDPLSAYTRVMVDVKTCPKAGSGVIEDNGFGSGEYLDDVIITGENFVDGPDLGLWLGQIVADGGEGEDDPYEIIATDVKYIDENTISADFNLADAPYGDYGLGCVNGCGIVTEPEENFKLSPILKVKVKVQKPLDLHLATNRIVSAPQPLEYITMTWLPVPDAELYRIYARFFDINGNLLDQASVIGTASAPQIVINVSSLPNSASGILELWVTALPGSMPDEYNYESKSSLHAFAYMQNFESGLGQWQARAEDTSNWRFIRSAVDCAYGGDWGLKSYGDPKYNKWILFASPLLEETAGATVARAEFVHRHMKIDYYNGYQVGWLYELPSNGEYEVSGYYPIPSVQKGWPYNSSSSPALQYEFGVSQYSDNNWSTDGPDWEGWWFSSLDISEILGDMEPNYATIGAAVYGGNDHFAMCVDDFVILVY